jgi:pimeloyl-ACP methyl ester carboxylesterase
MARRCLLFAFFAAVLAFSATAQIPQPQKIRVNNVDLTYVDQGSGEPVILLHGGQSDYRSWLPHLPRFADRYRVISYSRRYNYPNSNPIASNDHSAYVEADDLAALIDRLKLRHVHLVGTSIGAFTALIYAVKHPDNVASLSLAEPAIHAWVTESNEYKEFMQKSWLPAAEAFRKGDDRSAMRLLVDIFGGEGTFEKMPPEGKAIAMANSNFFKAATLSHDHSPKLSKDKVRRLKMPILIIQGENTFPMMKAIIAELVRVLPTAKKVVISGAGHGSPREKPDAFTNVVINFLWDANEVRTRPVPK